MKQGINNQNTNHKEKLVCPSCNQVSLIKHGFYRLWGIKKQRWLCKSCGRVTSFPLGYHSKHIQKQPRKKN